MTTEVELIASQVSIAWLLITICATSVKETDLGISWFCESHETRLFDLTSRVFQKIFAS